jgi:hypothetical protein
MLEGYLDITNRIQKDPSKKFSFTIAYFGRKSLFAFKNRLQDLISFFGNLSGIEVIYVDADKMDLLDVAELADYSRIIIPNESISIPKAVNTAVEVSSSNFVFVLPVNYRLVALNLNETKEFFLREPSLVCMTPYIINRGKKYANLVKFGVTKDKIEWMVVENSKNPATLTPNEFLGVYNRNLFLSLDGYNTELPSVLSEIEFGIRAWSSGCMIVSNNQILVDKIADIEEVIDVSLFDQSKPIFKYILAKKPILEILKDLGKFPFYLITFRFKDILYIFSEIKNFVRNRKKVSFYPPDLEKISSVISYLP